MRYALQVCSYLLWFPLIVLAIDAVRRSGIRRYPLIFTYLLATFLLAAMQVPASMAYHSDARQAYSLAFMYGIGEGVATGLLLAVVVSFIYRASDRAGGKRLLRNVLICASAVFMGASFVIHYDGRRELAFWIVLWTRDLNLCAAVLDLGLWTLLVASRRRDVLLLLLTGGMGIMFAGDAIGSAIRHIGIAQHSGPIFLLGNVITTLADSTFLYVWWRAFRQEARTAKRVAA